MTPGICTFSNKINGLYHLASMTKKLTQFLPAIVLTSASLLSYAQPANVMDGSEARVYKKIGETELSLHIFQPAGKKGQVLQPAIIFFFGGGWNKGTVNQFVPHSKHFAGLGMVAVVADYRVRSRHDVTPFDCVADAKSAVRWLRQHAAEYRIDPDRIVAAGGSAGGHLAASTALVDGLDADGEDLKVSARPNALVLFNPALDMIELRKHMRADSLRAKGISPVHHMRKGAPPTIIFHGTADTTVPFTQATRFCDAMKEYGNSCEVVPFEGRTHAFFNLSKGGGADYRTTIKETEEFLMSLGYPLYQTDKK